MTTIDTFDFKGQRAIVRVDFNVPLNEEGKITDTHLDYPEATRFLCNREGVHLIDLHAMTRTLYEAMGPEASKGAFVHYPANTYPGQSKPLADNRYSRYDSRYGGKI